MTLNCSSRVALNEGDNFTCLCESDGGNPPANVTWYKDGVMFGEVGTENQILKLLSVGKSESGTYKCVASSFPHKSYTREKSVQVLVPCKYDILPLQMCSVILDVQ